VSGSLALFFHPKFVAKVLARAARDRVARGLYGEPVIPAIPPAPA
jgi:hypothetical protein